MVTVSWIKLELDVHTFNAMIFAPFVERCRGAGLQFSTLAALDDSAEHRRALYDLNRQCSAAIPGRGGFTPSRSTCRSGSRSPPSTPQE